MDPTPQEAAWIVRHRKENLAKCSLAGLEPRPDLRFLEFPADLADGPSDEPRDGVLLTLGAPLLSAADAGRPLVLIDGTWRLARPMLAAVTERWPGLVARSLPPDWSTAYPRKQTECPDPERGLASVEALWVAYFLTGRPTDGLLDGYRWAEQFLSLNAGLIVHSP